ncbi:hypothetical protein [Kitasatospora sp. NPDC057223]|uniref:hypothetical protein n=1 Tax=Kitasatospora sp. NPDC057223 TaxID=3346055 RepID=UPI00363EC92A
MSLDTELLELAAQEDVSQVLLSRLIRHSGARRHVALFRRDLTPELIEEIIGLGSARTLAANSSLPAVTRAYLAGHPQTEVRAALAANASDDPPGILLRLSRDPEPSVRSFLAMNDRLDPVIRAGLATDPDPGVRGSLVQHWGDAPEPVRRTLLTDPDPEVRGAAVHAYVPPSDLLPSLLADSATRAGAIRFAEPTPDMAADPDAGVRQALAGIPLCRRPCATCWLRTRTCSSVAPLPPAPTLRLSCGKPWKPRFGAMTPPSSGFSASAVTTARPPPSGLLRQRARASRRKTSWPGPACRHHQWPLRPR